MVGLSYLIWEEWGFFNKEVKRKEGLAIFGRAGGRGGRQPPKTPKAAMSARNESESEGFERLLRLAQVGLSSRAEAWPALLGVTALRQTEPPDYFRDLLELATSGSDLAFETRQIWLDLSRTGHPRFNRSADRTDLASVLLAYARRCPAYGWHPWRVLLAARLLLVGCDRETAFWCLVAIVEQLPGAAHLVGCHDLDQHDDGEADKHDGLALMRLLRLAAPKVAAVLDRLDTSGAVGSHIPESYTPLGMHRGGGAAPMLGRAMRHLLLSPTAGVESEAALRATDAFLLLGWEAMQRLALGLLLERWALLAALPTDVPASYLLALDEMPSAELERVAGRAFGTAAVGAVSAAELRAAPPLAAYHPCGAPAVLRSRPPRWSPEVDRFWPLEQRAAARALLAVAVRARGDNVGLGRVPRDLILVEILPRALVAPRHYWRRLPDAAAAPAAAAWRAVLHARARAWEGTRGIVRRPPAPETLTLTLTQP